MLMDGRSGASGEYRYGFQGQEMDDEIKGKGNSVNYKYRMHDPRVGRFFAVDPLAPRYPHNSPYAFSENVVVNSVELEGLEKMEAFFGGSLMFTGDDGKNYKSEFAVVINYDINYDNFQLTVLLSQGVTGTVGFQIGLINGEWSATSFTGETVPIRFIEAGKNSSKIAYRGLEGLTTELALIFDAAGFITESIAETKFFEENSETLENLLDLPVNYVKGSLGKVLDMMLIEVTQSMEDMADNDEYDYGVSGFERNNEIKWVSDGNGGRVNKEYSGGVQVRIESVKGQEFEIMDFSVIIDKIQMTYTHQTEIKNED